MGAQEPSPFPFVSAERFTQGCEDLAALFEHCGREQHDWQRVELPAGHEHPPWLRIIRHLAHDSGHSDDKASREWFDPEEESDEETLPHNGGAVRPPQVEYSVVLSPVYRVPVLYFSLHDVPTGSNASIENVQDLIVPPQFIAQVRSVGVVGGISMTNHPVTDMPVFFVHPCNTAAALEEFASGTELAPLQYILQWLGIVGSCVGLQIPMDLALQADRAS